MKLKFNNDLNDIKLDFHNSCHLIGAFILAIICGFWISYLAWLAWEIGDGFKPWYTEYKFNPQQPKIINWLRQELLYSNYFSLQDALLWNLTGAFWGVVVKWILF